MRRAALLALALLIALPAEFAFATVPVPENLPAVAEDGGVGSPRADRLTATDRWIVVLRDGTTMEAASKGAGRLGIARDRTFRSAVRGYSAKLNKDQVAALRADPDVAAVVPDAVVSMVGQTTPRGVRRVLGPQSLVARINGSDERVDADVAIVDTGIDASHPDLNVAGGYNCSTTDPAAWGDGNGHGTHVAGTTGAIDNGTGVVGVAPGVRLWGVRILNSSGNGLVSWYVCGLDWIAAQRDPADPTLPLFEAVNMSVAKTGKDDRNCGLTNGDLIHQAICRLVASGVTVVAAAGNNSFNAGNLIPASYDEVITVSALADTDGLPGGLGGPSCYSWGTYDKDDTFADFSNYGSDVDLIAPGKCIWSTLPGNRYGYSSGTSMAAPHVTGAAALYKASRPLATPADVRTALRVAGTQDWNTATDPDGTHEPLLNVARLVEPDSWTVDATSPSGMLSARGATIQVPVRVIRGEGVTADVALSVDAPPGFGASLSAPVVGAGATTAALTVVVPPSLATGTYKLQVHGTIGDVTRTVAVTIRVDGDVPTMSTPRLAPVLGSVFNTSSYTAAVLWSAATDPTGSIARYQVQVRIGSGAWGAVSTVGPSARSVKKTIKVGSAYAIRVRAVDAAGNTGAWAEASALASQVIQDGSRTLARKGTWRRYSSRLMSGGTTRFARSAGASVTLRFTGRAVAVVMPYGRGRGKARVYVDGVRASTFGTYRRTLAPRRITFTRSWTTSATHVIKVVVVGTSGHPRVDLDAFLVIR
ncbi:MAG: S8 family serine peptidase [Chloroflexi bacterium]|nr:S8 family serine peptidase [Chloroflexota bacterium]